MLIIGAMEIEFGKERGDITTPRLIACIHLL